MFRTLNYLSLVLLVCFTVSCFNQITENSPELSSATPEMTPDNRKFASVIEEFERDNDEIRIKVKSKLIQFANEDENDKNLIAVLLIEKTKRICATKGQHLSGTSLSQLRYMSLILAEFRNEEAIDILIDCSQKRTVVGGLSRMNYPAQMALIEYGEKAIPKIKRKLLEDNDEIKCHLASILFEFDKKAAKTTLTSALENTSNSAARNCLNSILISAERN